MDSIIDDLMMQQQPMQQPAMRFVTAPASAPAPASVPVEQLPSNYVAPNVATRRKLGPTAQMWGQIAKQMFADFEKTQGKYPLTPPQAAQAQQEEGFPPMQESDASVASFANRWPLGDDEQVQQ
jgi:hypothetical protein